VTARTFNELFEPTPHLWVYRDPTPDTVLRWQILDANNNDRIYCRATTLDHAIAFMRAAERNGDATLDEASIEYERMNRLHSVRVDRAWELAYGEGIDLAPVIPIRKGA
jgi:hypothetical protein